ncbi:MAG: hypothetical protein ACR2H1_09025 [Limisphaerales bacterium]
MRYITLPARVLTLLVGLLFWPGADVQAQSYTIRHGGGAAGAFVRPPVNQLLSDNSFEFSRPAMSVNSFGQFVVSGPVGSGSYLVLLAPAYGLAAGYQPLPSGFTAQAIGYAGHIAGIISSNKTVAVWTKWRPP